MKINNPKTLTKSILPILLGTGLLSPVAHADNNSTKLVTEKSEVLDDAEFLDTAEVLDTVEVTGIGESSNSYIVEEVQGSNGLTLTPQETPQSISTVTRKQLNDQSINNLDQALNTTTGMNVVRDASRVRFMSRGFFVDQVANDGIYRTVTGRQGFSDNVDVNGNTDLAIFDKVEVLRGAAGLGASQSNPGGSVNLIRKKPTADASFHHSGELDVNNWGTKRFTADVSGGLKKDNSIRGRAVTVIEKSESFKDRVDGEKGLLYGVVEADVGDSGVITAGASYQKTSDKPDFTGIFLPCISDPNSYGKKCGNTPEIMKRETYLAQDWSRSDVDKFDKFLKYSHVFDNDWSFDADINHTSLKSDSRIGTYLNEVETWSGAASEGNFSQHMLHPFRYKKDDNQYGLKLAMNGTYELFNNEHELHFSHVYNNADIRSEYTQVRNSDIEKYTVTDGHDLYKRIPRRYHIYDTKGNEFLEPDWDLYGKNPTTYTDPVSGADTLRWYNHNTYTNKSKNNNSTVSTRLNFNDLHVLLGSTFTKYSHSSLKSEDVILGERKTPRSDYEYLAELKGSKILPYYGLTYDINPDHSIYASYTSVFKPQENTDTTKRNLVPPIEGKNYEVGYKSAWLDGRLNTALSLFQIEQNNRGVIKMDDNFMTSMNPVGQVISKGADFEISGDITDNSKLFLGYTYNRSKYSRAEKPMVDGFDWTTFKPIKVPGEAWDEHLNFSKQTPEQMLRIYSTYKFPENKWTIGGGVTAQTDTKSLYDIRQPGYALLNAHVRHDFSDNAYVSLTGKNLADKTYFENNEHRTRARNNFYGEPRSFELKVGWDF